MAPDRDDELARTATAAASDAEMPRAPTSELTGASVGRYRLERELGVGGMGVVHVAFDPDLERRIALKLLRNAGGDAAKRLQREARAMARLTHPNVVTVHEVGTASGRDYVAMELIEGGTLAEWLRESQRHPHEILEAFMAAGRGLAAAHDAGIVHRDFKPHNVLRSRKGRVVVTDFGLARDAHVQIPTPDPLETTLPVQTLSDAGAKTPSALSGLTATGSVLGTPAYMAPEQWTGGAVTPATDQFGYCVALWEALTGARPFVGPSIEELREQVAKGPEALDASKVPRRLRPVLRRGLDPDPKKRWPNMHDLIVEIGRADRRKLYISVGAGMILAAIGLFFVLRGGGAPAGAACAPPILDPAVVWSDATRMPIAKGRQAGHVRVLEADMRTWTATRATACSAEPPIRVPALTCLDGVLVRFDAVVRAVGQLGDAPFSDAGDYLIDPAACLRTPTPRLSLTPSPALVEVIATRLREESDPLPLARDTFYVLTRKVAKEPCASALAQLLEPKDMTTEERDRYQANADQEAEACGDDRVRAEVALSIATSSLNSGFLAEARLAKVRRAEAAVQRVSQPDLLASIDLLRGAIAARLGDYDQAITLTDSAAARFAERQRSLMQIAMNLTALDYRRQRGRAEDLHGVIDQLGQWRQLAVSRAGEGSDVVRRVDSSIAVAEIEAGDTAAATARAIRNRRLLPQDPAQTVTGRVVDERGAPVAGAKVALASHLAATSTSPAVQFDDDGSYRETVSGSDGRFTIPGAPKVGVVIAWQGDVRAIAKPLVNPVELNLGPASRIEGKVELGGARSGNVTVVIQPAAQAPQVSYSLLATLHPDGRFEIDGVPRGKVIMHSGVRSALAPTMMQAHLEVKDPVHRGVSIQLPRNAREVTVVVRSTLGTALQNANVYIIGGTIASMSILEYVGLPTVTRTSAMARPITKEVDTPSLHAASKPGDLFARMPAPEGDATACALALPDDFGDPDLQRKLDANLDKLMLVCVPITAEPIVVVEVPPFPRLD